MPQLLQMPSSYEPYVLACHLNPPAIWRLHVSRSILLLNPRAMAYFGERNWNVDLRRGKPSREGSSPLDSAADESIGSYEQYPENSPKVPPTRTYLHQELSILASYI